MRWRVGGFRQEEAAAICGVSPRTWRAWESGARRMPRATWAWFKANASTGFELTREWEGWRFHEGRLWSPEEVGFTPGQIRAIPWQVQVIRALQGRDRQQRQAPQPMNRVMAERHRLRGQLNVASLVLSVLHNELLQEEDPAIRQVGQRFEGLLQGLSAVQAEALRSTGMTREFA